MTIIKPTIGRVVWFWPGAIAIPSAAEDFFYDDTSQPCAALVAHVIDERTVNLAVMDQTGRVFSRQRVKLIQDGDERPLQYFCEWMPYQKGQAAKTEALEKASPSDRHRAADEVGKIP